jgi:hypothetical protein
VTDGRVVSKSKTEAKATWWVVEPVARSLVMT